jgi:hypothetical protein
MAVFTPAEKHTIAQMFRSTVTILDAHITSLGATHDEDARTAIRAQLTRWTTAGYSFVDIEPKERNFGARIRARDERQDIIASVAASLEWPYAATAASMGTVQIG